MTVLYPVARRAAEALERPLGRAAREREALELAGEAVAFVAEDVGPTFPTRSAALDAWAGRVDDDRQGRVFEVAAEDRYCALREVAAHPQGPHEPTFADGRRWPKPSGAPAKTGWRLSVSYWRLVGQARAARRKPEAATMDPAELRALARQPLRPVKPQQPLDIGLFEAPAPEAPHILIPDE